LYIWDQKLLRATQVGSRLHKYWHYLFVIAALAALVSTLALLNGYFHFSTSSDFLSAKGLSSSYVLAGYFGMFLSILISPIPDYILVPVYGYLSSLGAFNPLTTLLVCLVAAILPIEFVCGRFAGRPLLLKALSFIHVSEKDLQVADKWLVDHGHFSIFIATFIPFFYGIAALAAGTLKMNRVIFIGASLLGFGLRFVFLEYIGYNGIYIFTSSFDYSQRFLFSAILIVSIFYIVAHLVRIQYSHRTETLVRIT
jgi:membrane protein DedA with SNARE-associated domain